MDKVKLVIKVKLFMEVRRSNKEDIKEILNIFSKAREYMVANGNKDQWINGYPSKEIIEEDINNKNSYLIIDNNEIVGTFSFIIGIDETYKRIINGNWHKENIIYGTIHRLASNNKRKGISKVCFDYCSSKINYLRIDTHENNISMKKAILKYGFKECGNIFVKNGSIRTAYDYYRE